MTRNETGNVGQRRTNAAFTMTEVVISVVLMLLALGLLLSAFISSKRSVALAQTHLTALQIARGFRGAMLISVLCAVGSVLIGTTVSVFLNLPAGATIVMCGFLFFAIAMAVRNLTGKGPRNQGI